MASIVKKKLLMTFKNADGGKVSLSMDNPASYVDEATIKDVMQLIVQKNIFAPNDLDLVAPVEAKIVLTNTDEYDLA
ncbi:MAG: DUF2922 domain-containing protein [Cetobacterium sp.]